MRKPSTVTETVVERQAVYAETAKEKRRKIYQLSLGRSTRSTAPVKRQLQSPHMSLRVVQISSNIGPLLSLPVERVQ